MLSKLITKYQEPLYTFLHRAHLSDPIIDDILAWLSSVMEQLKPSEAAKNTIYLASILPSSEESLRAFAQELDELVQFHRRKRDFTQERVFRQTGKPSCPPSRSCSQLIRGKQLETTRPTIPSRSKECALSLSLALALAVELD